MHKQTLEGLQARNIGLERQMVAYEKERKENEAVVHKAAAFMRLARTFADAYHAHPWASTTVYEAGQDLIKAVRQPA